MSAPDTTAPFPARSPSPTAERMRRHRARRRKRIRFIEILVHESAVETLVRKQLLDPARREDGEAIREAIYDLLFSLSIDDA